MVEVSTELLGLGFAIAGQTGGLIWYLSRLGAGQSFAKEQLHELQEKADKVSEVSIKIDTLCAHVEKQNGRLERVEEEVKDVKVNCAWHTGAGAHEE